MTKIAWVMVVTFLGTWIFYPLYIDISYFETDFLDYCIGVIAIDDSKILAPFKRSQVAGLLPFGLSKYFGIINGIGVSSILCFAGILFVCLEWISLWSKAWRWRFVLSSLFLAQVPMVAMTRMFNFYPELILIFTLGAFWVAAAWRKKTKRSLFFGYLGASLCWLVDARGMVWGIALLGCLLWLLLRNFRWRKLLWHGCFLGGTHLFSWKIGQFAYHRYSSPLIRQMDVRPLFQRLEPENPLYAYPHEYPPDFIWGYSSLIDLFSALQFLFQQLLIPTPEQFLSGFSVSEDTYYFWLLWIGLAGLSGIIIFLKMPERIGLILPMVASLFVFGQIPAMVEPHLRFFMQGLPCISVLIVLAIIILERKIGEHRLWFYSIIGAFVLSWGSYFQWPLDRIIMNNHLAASFPEQRGQINSLPVQVGQQIHLFVSPMTTREKKMVRNWAKYCEYQLEKDQVFLPFFERKFEERKPQ